MPKPLTWGGAQIRKFFAEQTRKREAEASRAPPPEPKRRAPPAPVAPPPPAPSNVASSDETISTVAPTPTLANEEWRVVNGVWISNLGRTQTDKIGPYYPTAASHGYCSVRRNGKMHRIAKLVALAFHGPPPSRNHTADHINCDRADNRAVNLRWASKREQSNNQTGRQTPHQTRFVEWKQLTSTTWSGPAVTRVAAATTGVDESNVNRVANGKRRQDSGFTFRWLPNASTVATGVEEWRHVDGFDVSSMGNRLDIRGRSYTPRPARSMVYAVANNGRMRKNMHQLVCKAFHGPAPSPSHTVDHINGDKADNRACNLRWATKSEQLKNQPPRSNMARAMIRKPVYGRCKGTVEWTWFPSRCAAAKILNIKGLHGANISKCCTKKYKSTAGWQFRFAG